MHQKCPFRYWPWSCRKWRNDSLYLSVFPLHTLGSEWRSISHVINLPWFYSLNPVHWSPVHQALTNRYTGITYADELFSAVRLQSSSLEPCFLSSSPNFPFSFCLFHSLFLLICLLSSYPCLVPTSSFFIISAGVSLLPLIGFDYHSVMLTFSHHKFYLFSYSFSSEMFEEYKLSWDWFWDPSPVLGWELRQIYQYTMRGWDSRYQGQCKNISQW